jgi:hypothetical protein
MCRFSARVEASYPLLGSKFDRDEPEIDEGGARMDEVVRVVAARIPDRNLLLTLLSENGHDARPVNGVEIDVHCGPSQPGAGPAIYSEVEDAVMTIGDSFVPVKHQGVIYVRPPVG